MSGILAANCCCGQLECAHQRDFSVSISQVATGESYWETKTSAGECPGFPDCPSVDTTCTAPALGSCLYEFVPQTLTACSPLYPGIKQHAIASVTCEAKVTVPFVNTTIETVTTGACAWITGGVDSGLYFEAQRDVDHNAGGFITYDADPVNDACCTEVQLNPSGAYHDEIRIDYRWRCTYSLPPAYLSVRRPALYAGYTWEITAGHFIVRDAGAVIVADIDLTTRTLAQARTDIDALAYVICTANQGACAADAMAATLMYDRAAVLLETFDVRVPLVPAGTTVSNEQDGKFGPSWTAYSINLDNTPPTVTCGITYVFKDGCLTSGPLSYAGGQDAAAELMFCKAISAERTDWKTTFDPYGITPDCAEIPLCCFQPSDPCWPQGYWTCDGTAFAWVQTAPASPGIARGYRQFVPYGNRARVATSTPQYMDSDGSTISPTTCSYSSMTDIDFAICCPGCATACRVTATRFGWAMSRLFKIIRL